MKRLISGLVFIFMLIQPVSATEASETATKEAFDLSSSLWIALAVGAVIALIVVLYLRSQLKSVHFQDQAGDYVVPNSLNVTRSQDVFLYQTVTRVEKPQNNSKKR